MMTARMRSVTGMETGRELLNWYISDPGDVGTVLRPCSCIDVHIHVHSQLSIQYTRHKDKFCALTLYNHLDCAGLLLATPEYGGTG